MGTRKHQSPRCPDCRMLVSLCLCESAHALGLKHPLRNRVSVIMHHREWRSTTNTTRWLQRVHPQIRILIRGLPESPLDVESYFTADLSENKFYLFPDDRAQELSPVSLRSHFKNNLPFHMILPDGSWRQAQKVHLREDWITRLPFFKLPAGSLSRYQLRREPQPEGHSTFEAMVKALGALEGDEFRESHLKFFDDQVLRVLNSRKGIF